MAKSKFPSCFRIFPNYFIRNSELYSESPATGYLMKVILEMCLAHYIWLWVYLMKVILEMCRAHYIWLWASRSRRFRILARKIEFGVFGLFRMRKKIFSWKNRGFWWISILFPHIIRKSVRNCPNTPNELGKKFGIVRILRIDLGKKFGIVRILRMTSEKNSEFRIKVGNYHPYSENIVRFGSYSKVALRKFPH